MTIEQWNQLRPGDFIQRPNTLTRYKVHALGEETVDIEKDAGGIITLIISHTLLIDPLLNSDDPYYPDITEYESGEADGFKPVYSEAATV
jgi:hypothetical protein